MTGAMERSTAPVIFCVDGNVGLKEIQGLMCSEIDFSDLAW